MRFREFVALTASMMALTALSLDMMLPALPIIGAEFAIGDANTQQFVIVFYLAGFAGGHLIAGPLSDRNGRRPVLVVGLLVYLVGSLMAALAPEFTTLLAARVIQGLGASAPRVVALAIVRDRYAGRRMSRVMSFVMMIFILVPVIAPSLGELVVQLGTWRIIFAVLLLAGASLILWIWLRLEETRPARSVPSIVTALDLIVRTPQCLGYTLAVGFMFGNLMTYIGTAEQVFTDVYDLGGRFTLVFGAIALAMIPAAFSNAHIVERVGMRRVSHTALLLYFGLCVALFGFNGASSPSLSIYAIFMAGTFFCFGHIVPNFNALAMEPLGEVAGVGSSVIGFWMTAGGAAFGAIVGQQFDGTVQPILIGFTLLSATALATVLITERGRLFRVVDQPHEEVNSFPGKP
jgi:DHA1 family bicyclomycin/chloramphenicol resistance-like MFS transporter